MALKLVNLLTAYDSDGNGYISGSELGALLKQLGSSVWTDEDVVAILCEADRNCGGKIDYQEFVGWITQDIPQYPPG